MSAPCTLPETAPVRDTATPLAVALFNDTADQPHVGCQAVSGAHRQMLRRAGAVVRHASYTRDWLHLGEGSVEAATELALRSEELRQVFSDVDAVVVNGEGTIHHQYGRHLLAVLAAAQRLGVPTLLVNAVLQDVDDAREVLARLTDCTVRDSRSSAYLTGLGVPHRLVPDSLFEAEFSDAPSHDFSGALVITDCHPGRTHEFQAALDALRGAWPGPVGIYALEGPERAGDWQHALADLGQAAAVVTGRHHGACLALRAGVPFVALPSNTWKVEGLLDLLNGYPDGAADVERSLVERVEAAVRARDWYVHTSAAWKQRLPLDTFHALRRVSPSARQRVARPRQTSPRTLEAVRLLAKPGGRVLHCGAAGGTLVRALRADAIDAHGVDVSTGPGGAQTTRVSQGTPWALPFLDDQFFTVVASAGWLEHLERDELDAALAELVRVAGDTVILETSGRPLRAERAAGRERRRDWWEARLAVTPLRRHSRALAVVDYESLEDEAANALLILQKPSGIGAGAGAAASHTDPAGHMDALRQIGPGAEATLARYEWARGWIRPGDTVVDAACGPGCGAALLWDGSEAARVVGLDGSSTAITYARDTYLPNRPGLEFRVADAGAWDGWADASVDCIVSFDTLAHLADPAPFLAAARRVLRPGGRFLCSVPNMRVNEPERDADPRHLHVFDLDRLVDTVSPVLLVDEVYAQAAGGDSGRFAPRRLLRSIGWPDRDRELIARAEWWLLSGIRHPLEGADVRYAEQVFPAPEGAMPNAVAFARDYVHPWAIHALVMGSFRVRSPHLLIGLAEQWLSMSPPDSADTGAALCILAYRELESAGALDRRSVIPSIEAYCALEPLNPQVRRWQISLQFVRGRLHLDRGEFQDAEACFRYCAAQDAAAFTPHLETKTTEAAWLAGRLALERGDDATAAADWSGVSHALERLKSAPLSDWLLSPERPAAFERGDGLREIAMAVDNAALSANALRHLRDPSGAWRQGPGAVDRNFQRNAARLLDTVAGRGGEILALRAEVDRMRAELQSVHQQWQTTRETLHDVTRRLHAALGTRDRAAAPAIGSRWKAENAALRAIVRRIVRQSAGTAHPHGGTDMDAAALLELATVRHQAGHEPDAPVHTAAGVRVGIFGTGEAAMKVWEALAEIDTAGVVWFADNDPRQQGKRLLWMDVIAPAAIPSQACEAIVIGSMARGAISEQLLALGIPAERIVTPDVRLSVDAIRQDLRSALARM